MDTTTMLILMNLMLGFMVVLFGIGISMYCFMTNNKIFGIIATGVTLTMFWVIGNIFMVVYKYIKW